MTQHDKGAKSDVDIVGTNRTPAMSRLVTTLDAVCAPSAPPRAARLDAAVAHALQARADAPRRLAPALRPRPFGGLYPRLAALAALVAVVGAGMVAYLSGQSPTPVSAQAVLSRAAAAGRLAPDQAAHLTYAFSPGSAGRGGGVAGPMEVWLQADAHGNTAHVAFTQKIYGANGVIAAVQRMVLAGGTGRSYVYDPHANAVAISDATARQFSLGGLDLFDPSGIAAYLAKAARGASGQARLAPRQTLNGVTVDVVQVPGDPRQGQPPVTAYFDAQSYLFRGADTASGQYTLRMRVTAYDLVAAYAVPPRAFALDAPSTARVVAHVAVPEYTPGD